MSEFSIPIAKTDLLKLSAENAYVVNDVISVRNLRNNLPKCKRALTSSGYSYILNEFDTLFSVLHEWDKLDSSTKEEAWHIVLKGCEICARELGSVLETFESDRSTSNQNDMKRHRNIIKMHTYLLCQFVDMFENELNVNAKSVISGNTGRGKGGKGNRRAGDREPPDVNLSMNWLAECESAINIIDQMFRLKLDKLWDPAIVDTELINLSANCCYKLLENREMASNNNIRMAIISLLANLVRRHRHGFTCAVKLPQLLQCYPHMVNCLLAIVKSFTEDEKITGTVRDLLKEICSYDGAHLERDSQASQNFSNFLIEVARLYPSLAQSILPLLRSRLDDEPYQMRNCVLSIIGEILPMFAKREQLDHNERVQRDRLMDLLQEHIHDVNGYVRAKALHIWHNIVTLGGLPVSRQSKLAALLVGSLGAMMDVSASARKNACRTLTAMILQCPAAKLTANELQQVVNKEKKRLERLEEILAEHRKSVSKRKTAKQARVNTIDENDGVTPSDLTEPLTNPLTNVDGDGDADDVDDKAKGKNKSEIQKKTTKKKKKKGKSNKKMHKKNKKTKLTTGLSDSDESPTRRSNIADDDDDEEEVEEQPEGDVVDMDGDDDDADDNDDAEEEDEEETADEGSDDDEEKDADVTLCPTAEVDAAAALEKAIHSAAAVAEGNINSNKNNNNNANGEDNDILSTSHLCLASTAQTEISSEVVRQRACIAYLLETSTFLSHIQTAIKDFQAMLSSKTLTDVTEAIEFFVVAKQAGIKGLEQGIRLLLALIWSQEEGIRKAVVEACQKLYLQPDSEEFYQSNGNLTIEGADLIATNLSNFVRNSEMGDLVSMERVIQQLISSNQLDITLIDYLWQRFIKSASGKDKESTEDAKSMLIIIKMIVKPGPKEIDNYLDTLIRYGLEPVESCPIDLERVKFTCEVLERMVPPLKSRKNAEKSSTYEKPFRLPTNHALFTRLKTILISTISQAKQVLWIPTMEQAIGVIYDMAETPDSIMCYLLRSVAEKLVQFKSPATTMSQTNSNPSNEMTTNIVINSQPTDEKMLGNDVEQENIPPPPPPEPPSSSQMKSDPELAASIVAVNVPTYLLSRFLALIGHITLKQLIFLESAVLTELKRRASIKEDRNSKHKSKSSRKITRTSRVSMTEQSGNASATSGQSTVDEDCGLVGVAADDAEAEYIREICDEELLKSPDLILHHMLNFVTYVCSHPSTFSDETVQASASLALAKMMLVSAEVCEPRLQLLFTMAERSQSEIVRANLIVALGDLCRRFPNLIEPWTPNLYARLRDTSAKVRTNALNTLSHLILNDMVKVKGQISEMTVCLVDEIERLNILARRFFRELSQKGNALYNVVPDIISRLSDPNIGVSEEHFRSIMEFLIPLIVKERLCETLVEKLCSRFRTTTLERQWRDLAFCLNVMPFSERMMKVLYENLPAFADKLCINEVYAAFECIIINVKKLIKPDAMATLEEFEAKVKELHDKGVADEAAVRRAEVAAKSLKQRSSRNTRVSTNPATSGKNEMIRRNVRRTVTNRTAVTSNIPSGDEDVDVEESSPPPTTTTRAKSARTTRTRTKLVFSSDEEELDNE